MPRTVLRRIGTALLLGALAGPGLAAEGPRLIVSLKPGASAQAASAALPAALPPRLGLRLLGPAGAGQMAVQGAPGQDAAALMQALAADPAVASVQLDRPAKRHALPNDPRLLSGGSLGPAIGQWYLRAPNATQISAIDAVRGWDLSQGGSLSSSVIVAVLDSGIRFEHPDLAGKLLPGYDFIGDTDISVDGDGRDADASDPGDFTVDGDANGCGAAPSSWHGTQVAGLIGAATDNGAGMAGAGWNLRVLPLRVLGRCVGFQSDIVAAMRWAAGLPVDGLPANPHPAKVLNLSLGSEGACDAVYQQAIDAVRARGVVVVASVGNSNGRAVTSPANCRGVIAVGGLRHNGRKVGFSDVGPEVTLSAPAGNCENLSGACLYPLSTTTDTGLQGPVASSYTGDGADATLGTSFGTPLVAATAGLVLTLQPGLSPDEVRSVLQGSARPFPAGGTACVAPGNFDQLECRCTPSTCGAGMLDLGAALSLASRTVPGGADSGEGGGGGGGAGSLPWLLALAAAVLAAGRTRRAG